MPKRTNEFSFLIIWQANDPVDEGKREYVRSRSLKKLAFYGPRWCVFVHFLPSGVKNRNKHISHRFINLRTRDHDPGSCPSYRWIGLRAVVGSLEHLLQVVL